MSWSGATIHQKAGTHFAACLTLNPAYSGSEARESTGVILEPHRPPLEGETP
jgi:hypothetical protein